jgi:hypothetical protein
MHKREATLEELDGRRTNDERISLGLPQITKAAHEAQGKSDRRGSVRGPVLLLTKPGAKLEPFQSVSLAAQSVIAKKILDRSFDLQFLTTLLTTAANEHHGAFGMQIRYESDLEDHPFADSVAVYKTGPIETYIYGLNGETIVSAEYSSAAEASRTAPRAPNFAKTKERTFAAGISTAIGSGNVYNEVRWRGKPEAVSGAYASSSDTSSNFAAAVPLPVSVPASASASTSASVSAFGSTSGSASASGSSVHFDGCSMYINSDDSDGGASSPMKKAKNQNHLN